MRIYTIYTKKNKDHKERFKKKEQDKKITRKKMLPLSVLNEKYNGDPAFMNKLQSAIDRIEAKFYENYFDGQCGLRFWMAPHLRYFMEKARTIHSYDEFRTHVDFTNIWWQEFTIRELQNLWNATPNSLEVPSEKKTIEDFTRFVADELFLEEIYYV